MISMRKITYKKGVENAREGQNLRVVRRDLTKTCDLSKNLKEVREQER